MNPINPKDRLPELTEANGMCSKNVLAWCNDRLMVMCLMLVRFEDDWHTVWANCNGDINGYGEFDDNYYPEWWWELPTAPN
jgi:hypothetical protein